ncbi:serine/threonine/tyrosine-interacting-like protein 1 [Amphiura filiformis]|uniref:serine/threonine/tyrosine-interacting-like protein 1 n=1 Tax=Amphiura filiformis TaxID=82378 RepID=UPI003B2162BB
MANRIVICEPTELYNILQQGSTFPCVSDPNYLLLLDARETHEYNESHIITSKLAPRSPDGKFLVPYDAELECKMHVIILDNRTHSIKIEGPAMSCAQVMADMGSRNPVKVLRGGYEEFSALYPFLRTQKIMFMPRELDVLETYPVEVFPGQLYLGNHMQAGSKQMCKDLKIKAVIYVGMVVPDISATWKEDDFLFMQASDEEDADLYGNFQTAVDFIGKARNKNQVVLVASDNGISRGATIVLAYLMAFYKWPIKHACKHLLDCKSNIRPHRTFVMQLSRWEETLGVEDKTDVSDPHY